MDSSIIAKHDATNMSMYSSPLEQSTISENGLLYLKNNNTNVIAKPINKKEENLKLPRLSKVAPLNRNIKINFGTEALQDPIYKFKDNTVRTTKYTLLTWAPKSLILQFRRVANIYFLLITILTCLSFSPKQPASQIMTFTLVLVFTMLKEGYEDVQRYKQDKEANNTPVLVFNYQTKKFETKRSEDIRVGDLLRIDQDEPLQADLLILKASAESGIGFVNTMNLDGETNLKEKICLKKTQEWTDNEIFSKKGVIQCEAPNAYLDTWEGSLIVNNGQLSCSFKQLGLRGTTLKNTKYVYGLAVYTGHSTKIMKNAKRPPSKTSKVLRKMNTVLYTVFALQAIIDISYSIASIAWQKKEAAKHSYINLDHEVNFGTFIVRYFTFLVAYSHMIPISLYVALELLKLLQGSLMKYDRDMYYAPLDKYANVKTSELVEELGQVQMIFSDKTGTLTMNEMEFKKCSVNLHVYGENNDPSKVNSQYTVNGDSSPYNIMMDAQATADKKALKDFFTLLAVCHTVMPEYDPATKIIKYQASSPDELALVEGAAKMGFKFEEKTSSGIKISLPSGETQNWEVFAEFPFDSTRKRMSLIVRKVGSQEYTLMTKGADSIMFPRLTIDRFSSATVQEHLDRFAVDGLRTLVVAQRNLTAQFVSDFIQKLEDIKVSNSPNKEEELGMLYDQAELSLELVGCTAIEDKLQEGVPETIATLMEAGIRIWVLTGDKQETAIEIAKSCKLLQPDMECIILSSDSANEYFIKLDERIYEYKVNLSDPIPPLDQLDKFLKKKIAVIINGSTLTYALESNQEAKNKFFRLALLANSVVCCRVSPKQKADVVNLAKSFGPWTTLSVGDGANDVPMIMEAHIGVGIYGKEGTQAARTADFALGQFRYLKKLLLYHGRVTYRRVSNFILYYFYKNVIVVFTEVYFAFFNGFSGQIFFADWLPMLYNTLWTTWPPLFSFALEKDVPMEYSFQYPKLYKAGPKNYYFNLLTFWRWMAYAAWHGVLCFFLPVMGLTGVNDRTGEIRNHWWISTISFSLIMHTVTIKLFIETTFWNVYSSGITILSVFVYYCSIAIISTNGLAKLIQPQLNGVVYSIFESLRAWIVLVFIPWVAVGPDIIFIVFKRLLKPNPSDRILSLYKGIYRKPRPVQTRTVQVK